MAGKANSEERKANIDPCRPGFLLFAVRCSLFAFLSALPACTSYAPPPRLTLTRAYVSQESKEGLVITFNLDALNTNSEELPLQEVRYTLSLDGKPVFFGVRSPEATLRRLGTQPISFPAVVRLEPGQPRPTGQVAYAIDGRLAYTTPGNLAQVLFDLRFRRPTVAFHEAGLIDFGPAPQRSAAAP